MEVTLQALMLLYSVKEGKRKTVPSNREKHAAIQPFLFAAHFLLTGSKVETAATAPPIATRTTPPATTLRSRFLSDGDTPGATASAISGTTAAAKTVRAAGQARLKSFFDPALMERRDPLEATLRGEGLEGNKEARPWRGRSRDSLELQLQGHARCKEEEVIAVDAIASARRKKYESPTDTHLGDPNPIFLRALRIKEQGG